MSKGGGGGGTSTTVQKADPWSGVQPGLNRLYAGALSNYDSGGPQYYPGSTLAGSNWHIDQSLNQGWDTSEGTLGQVGTAMSQLGDTAGGLHPWQNPAYQGLTDTVSGKYLTEQTNPYLRGMFNDASGAVTDQFKNAIAPGLASQFSMAGRTGSGAAMGAFDNATGTLGRTLNNLSSNIYGGAYENERGRQQQAMQTQTQQYGMERGLQQQAQLSVPQMASSQQQQLSQLLGIGQYRQGQAQDQINADMARFNFGQNAPTANLQTLNQLLQGGSSYAGKTETGPNQNQSNPFQSALGGASAMYGLGGKVGGELGGILGGPWGLLGGALLGGLFG